MTETLQFGEATATAPAPRRTSRLTAGAITVLSLVGAGASLELLLTEIEHRANPVAELGCDVNVLVGCGASLMSWQAHLLFGIPNSVLGLASFLLLALFGGAVFFHWRPPTWMWGLTALGGIGSLGLVAFFLYHTVTDFGTLCPYCLVVWVATIPTAVLLVTEWLRSSGKAEAGVGRVIVRERWAWIVLLFAVVIVVVAIGLADVLVKVL